MQSKKQEAFEEQLKFSESSSRSHKGRERMLNLKHGAYAENHFRALDEEEISFLDSIVDDNNDEERERKKAIQDELRAFKQCALAVSLRFLLLELNQRRHVEP